MTETWALNLFDRLHVGHEVLIDRLRDMPNPVAVVADGELVAHELEMAAIIQPATTRLKKLEGYLAATGLNEMIPVRVVSSFAELVSAHSPTSFLMFEGPCCEEIEARALSLRKQQLGFKDIVEHLKPMRADDGDKVSSARIRKGEIDRLGRHLRGTSQPPRRLEFSTRSGLKIPKGDVYDVHEVCPEKEVVARIERDRPAKVISVGDVTTASVIAQGYTPDVCIVDGITRRGGFEGSFRGEKEYVIYNPPAVIFPEAWSVIDTAIHDDARSLIVVDGEEDLMGFPVVLLASEGSVMLYGQPDVGIVWCPADQENKSRAQAYLEDMPTIT